MKYRRLRIAWSMACGMMAAVLLAFCVRSYWRIDTFNYQRGTTRLAIDSFNGRVGTMWGFYTQPAYNRPKLPMWRSFDVRTEFRSYDRHAIGEPKQYYFGIQASGGAFPSVKVLYSSIGYWFPLGWCVLGIAAPWALPKRFNLLTLLMITTALAVAFGLMNWLAIS